MSRSVVQPKVSVLTTVWNGAAYITSAIESVTKQSFGDWEHIIVDDGSTDETVSRIQEFDDPRIRLIDAGRVGRGAALNLGLDACSGEYIAVLDADDVCSWLRLQQQVELLDANPHIDLLCGIAVFSEDDLPSSADAKTPVLTVLQPRHLVGKNMITHSTVAIRRHVLLSVDGYDESRRNLFDLDLWIRLAKADRVMAICNITFAMIRIHQGRYFASNNRLSYQFAGMMLRFRAAASFGRSATDYLLPVAAFLYGFLPESFRLSRAKTKFAKLDT